MTKPLEQETTNETPKSEYKNEDDSEKAPRLTNAQWWRAKELGRKPHEILDGIVKQIEDDQQARYHAYREYERLFGATVGATYDDSLRFIASSDLIQNELQATIETLWAQVFKNRVVPAVSVSEADWDEWDRAKGYSRWLEGAFDEAKVYSEHIPQGGAYSLVHGTGIIRVGYKDLGDKSAQVICWAVNPRFFAVDRIEAKHGCPRSCYFKDHVDRYVLYETYKSDDDDYYGSPEDRMKGIMDASSNDDVELGTQNFQKCDMITVREAYHLPSGPKAKDGRHVLWIKGCTLVDEEFDWDTFPFIVMRFGVKMEGYYGESAVKRLAPTQKLLDKLNGKIDEGQEVMCVPRIIAQTGSGLKKAHLDDIPGGVIEVNNIAQIRDWNASGASPEMYADRDSAGQKMRMLLGVSDFASNQELPKQTREFSAPAMERMIEQGQARHAMFHAEYEDGVVALADLFARQAEDCQKDGYDVVVRAPSGSHLKNSIEVLNFKDVCIDRKRLKLKVQPMSQLPQTFSGKVDAIVKMRGEAQLPIDPKTALRMLEIPDVSGATDMLVSSEEIIMKNLSYMCKHGEYIPPLPFDNHDLIIQLTTQYINMYRVREDADNVVVGLLAQYIDDAILMKKGLGTDPNAPPSTMAAVGGMGPAPLGPPGMQGMPPPGMPPMGGQMAPPVPGMAGGAPMGPVPPGAPMPPPPMA